MVGGGSGELAGPCEHIVYFLLELNLNPFLRNLKKVKSYLIIFRKCINLNNFGILDYILKINFLLSDKIIFVFKLEMVGWPNARPANF